MSNTDTAVRNLVECFVEQLRALIQQAALDTVQSALSGSATPARQGSKRGRAITSGVGRATKGAKRTPEELEALVKKLHSHIAKNPGQRIEQIGTALDVPTKELALPIKKLLSEKKLSKKGAKRATTYFSK